MYVHLYFILCTCLILVFILQQSGIEPPVIPMNRDSHPFFIGSISLESWECIKTWEELPALMRESHNKKHDVWEPVRRDPNR